MITFDVLTLKAFIQEQEDFFNGARISKIQQPTRREFILTLRNKGETRPFYINISPEFCHVKNLPYLCKRVRLQRARRKREHIERITIETRVVQEQKAALKSCRGKLKSIL